MALLPALFLSFAHLAPVQDDAEIKRLQDEIVQLRLENLRLKLDIARREGKPEAEARELENALGSGHAELCEAAFREIANLTEERRKTFVPTVVRRFEGGHVSFKVHAIAFLGPRDMPEAEALVLKAAADPLPAVRRAAAQALKPSVKEPAFRALVKLLDDADRDVKAAAIDALGVPRREAAVAPLVAALAAEKDEKILEKTVDALGAIGSVLAVDPLLALLDRKPSAELRWTCINSLGRIGDARAAARLRTYLEPEQPANVREVTIQALGKLKDADSLPRLGEILRRGPDESLRKEAAKAIALMGDLRMIESALLPVYLVEKTEAVRLAVQAALETLAADRLDVHETLVAAFLKEARRGDAAAFCARLHSAKPAAELLPRHLALEESVASSLAAAKETKSAVDHYRRLLALAPQHADARRQLAVCYRELEDFEAAAKHLQELAAALPRGDAEWWKIRLEGLGLLQKLRNAEPQIEEAHALLQVNPPPHPEERRKALEQALREGTLRLIAPLAEKDEAARAAALAAVARLGKQAILTLAALLEEGPPKPGAIAAAGNRITGTTFEPSTAEAAKAAAAEWRAWHARNSK
jgi:HEAT repeat protein